MDLRTMSNYDPALPVRSFQLHHDIPHEKLHSTITVHATAPATSTVTVDAVEADQALQQQILGADLQQQIISPALLNMKLDNNENEIIYQEGVAPDNSMQEADSNGPDSHAFGSI